MQPQSYKSQTDIYHSVHIGAVMLVLRWSCYYLQDIFLDMKQRLEREWERERGLLISMGWKLHEGISIYIIYCPFFISCTLFLSISFPFSWLFLTLHWEDCTLNLVLLQNGLKSVWLNTMFSEQKSVQLHTLLFVLKAIM